MSNYFNIDDLLRKEQFTDIVDSKNRPIYGVYYICCIGHYQSIVNEQLECIVNSGLYKKTAKLILFISMYNDSLQDIIKKYDTDNKCMLIKSKENLYEKYAINNYKSYIDKEYYYLYYFHTKAVTRGVGSIFDRRRKILNYYTLQLYEINIELLQTYDAVGCSLTRDPSLHFSGNFWWSKSEHVKKLSNVGNEYLDPEMYICKYAGKYTSLSQDSNDGDIHSHITKNINTIRNELTSIPL
jgi:hypothetical protein